MCAKKVGGKSAPDERSLLQDNDFLRHDLRRVTHHYLTAVGYFHGSAAFYIIHHGGLALGIEIHGVAAYEHPISAEGVVAFNYLYGESASILKAVYGCL